MNGGDEYGGVPRETRLKVVENSGFLNEQDIRKKVNFLAESLEFCQENIRLLSVKKEKYITLFSKSEFKPRETIVIEILDKVEEIIKGFGPKDVSFFVDSLVKDIKRELLLLLDSVDSLGKVVYTVNKKSGRQEVLDILDNKFSLIKKNYLDSWGITDEDYGKNK